MTPNRPFGGYRTGDVRQYAQSMTSLPLPSRQKGVARLWSATWRLLLVVVLGFTASTVVWGMAIDAVEAAGGSMGDRAGLVFLDLVAGVAAMALYPLRRKWPLLVVGTIVALSSVSVAAFPAAMLAVVSLATRRRAVEIVVICTVLLPSFYVSILIHPTDDPLSLWVFLVVSTALMAIPVLTGMYIGARRQAVQALQERADQLQREQDARLEAARLGERSRIARDMHDALAHRLSLVSLHAGALEYRTDLSPEQTRSTAGVVLENARLAASDLREVLGVLRDPVQAAGTDMTRPAASVLDGISLLAQESRNAGNPVTLTMDRSFEAHLDELPAALRQHLHRVIQEGLTNVRKHAPGTPSALSITGAPGSGLSMALSNPLPTLSPGNPPMAPGFGLTGLRERARIAGGDVSTGAVDGVFTLRAWFPWTD